MIVFGETHLRWILGKYAASYNGSRIHRSLDKDSPFHRAIEHLGIITSRPVLSGLHHQYCSDFRYTQVIPGGFIANPLFSSKALEHLIVARARPQFDAHCAASFDHLIGAGE
jgi:hypothetical protein